MEIGVSYKSEIITQDGTIEPRGANSLWFENLGAIGDSTATIDGSIPVAPGNSTRDFYVNQDPNCVITNSLSVSFGAGTKNLLVVRRYYSFKKC